MPSTKTMVAPARQQTVVIMGPTTQLKSLIHIILSSGFRSIQTNRSKPIFTVKPTWVRMVPLGFPVVPEV